MIALVTASPAFAGKKHDGAEGMFKKAAKKFNREHKNKMEELTNKSESVKKFLADSQLTMGKLTDVHRLYSFGEGGTLWATELAVFNVNSTEGFRSSEMAVMIKTESEDEDNGAGPKLVKAEVAVVNAQPPSKFELVLGKE